MPKMPFLRSMARKLIRAVDKTVHPDRIYMSADISVHSIETMHSNEENAELYFGKRENDVYIYPGSELPMFKIYQDPCCDLPALSSTSSFLPIPSTNFVSTRSFNSTFCSTIHSNPVVFTNSQDHADTINEEELEPVGRQNNNDILRENDFSFFKVSIRARGRPVYNTIADRLDFRTYLDGLDNDRNERSNDQRRIAEIAEQEAGRQRQQQEEIRAYQDEFPTIFDNDFVEILLSEEIVFDLLTNTSIIEEQLLITRNPNFISNTFLPFTYTQFNYGQENDMNTMTNHGTQTETSLSEYHSLQERRYLTMQFRRFKNGWRPSSRVLLQLQDNEINRLHNSEETITVGIFNRVDLHNHRIVMFI